MDYALYYRSLARPVADLAAEWRHLADGPDRVAIECAIVDHYVQTVPRTPDRDGTWSGFEGPAGLVGSRCASMLGAQLRYQHLTERGIVGQPAAQTA